ncbi:MAG: C40 family peptidase [Lachnospiraceae bacterium]|nr:C40 family peptidase [Lachnospiraceae bacterium]
MKKSILGIGFTFFLIVSVTLCTKTSLSAHDKFEIPTSGVSSYLNLKHGSKTAGVSKMLFNKNKGVISTDNHSVSSAPIEGVPEAGSQYGFKHLGMAIPGGNVNVRESASSNSKRVGKLPDGCACEIVGCVDDWYQITSGEVSGFVKKEYLLVGQDAENRAKEFLVSNSSLETSLNQTEAYYGRGVSDVRSSVVSNALNYKGLRYIWGGTSLTSGADCSGFVMRIYAQYGVYLPHSSAAQSNIGTRVSTSELLPGDLVFYGYGRVSHVAIYIGNGMVISELNPGAGCKVTGLNYPGRFVKATRVLP